MYKNILLVLILALSMLVIRVYGEESVIVSNEYIYEIKVDKSTDYSKFSIPDDVYMNVKNINSIYLNDEDTKEHIPYIIVNSFEDEKVIEENYDTALIVEDKLEQYTSYIYKVYKNENDNFIYNQITFEMNKDKFSEVISIYGSNDNINFTAIKKQNIYNIDNEKANTIYLEEPINYEFIKIIINEDNKDIKINNILVSSNIIYTQKEFYKKDIKLDFKINNLIDDKATEIMLDTRKLRNRKVFALKFDIEDDNFSRQIAIGSINNNLAERLEKHENDISEIDLTNYTIKEGKDYIFIKNKDDKPLNIKEITGVVLEDFVVFDNRNHSNITLNFDDITKEPKEYDVSITIDEEELVDNISLAKVNNKEIISVTPEDDEVNIDLILNITLVIVVVVITLLGIKKLKQ